MFPSLKRIVEERRWRKRFRRTLARLVAYHSMRTADIVAYLASGDALQQSDPIEDFVDVILENQLINETLHRHGYWRAGTQFELTEIFKMLWRNGLKVEDRAIAISDHRILDQILSLREEGASDIQVAHMAEKLSHAVLPA